MPEIHEIRDADLELSAAIDTVTLLIEEAHDFRVRNAYRLALHELMRCAAETGE